MLRRTGTALVGAALAALVAPAFALADHGPEDVPRDIDDGVIDSPLEVHENHDQHGGPGGHLPASVENVELIGRADIEGAAPGRVADVAAFGNYAYVTVRDPAGCFDAGVAIFDISDPTNPVQIGFIDATDGSFPGEGSQVIDVKTEFFRGQILVFNNELCAIGGEGGVSLWDVTDPTNPVVLTAHAGDDDPGGFFSTFNQIHSAFAWQAGKRAFVVIVDNEEDTDVDILEITDPRNPVLLIELNLNDFGVLQEEGTPLGANSFLHDMVVQKVRGTWTMLLSYWDGGWVLLDVDDPANPIFIDDFDYPDPDTLTGISPAEGNAHQAEFSPNGKFIIGTDEDFAPYRTTEFRITTGPHAGVYPSVSVGGAQSPAILPDLTLNGPVVYGGYGCPGSAPIPRPEEVPGYLDMLEEGEETIIVLQRGPFDDPSAPEAACFPGEKAHEAVLAGWDAVLFVQAHIGPEDPPFCGSGAFVDEVVAVCTSHEAFHRLFDVPPFTPPWTYPDGPAIGDIGERIEVGSEFDGWGYVRLLDSRTMTEIDAYAIDEALDPAFAFGFGDLTVHEVAVDPWKKNLAYLSYYAGGLRVIEYGKDGLTEVGHFIAEGGNNFWGVEVHRLPQGTPGVGKETLILASDRDSGLWIFRYTGR